MKMLRAFAGLFILLGIMSFCLRDGKPLSAIGREVTDFSLKSTANAFISLSGFKDVKGFIVVFTCNHCPFARLYSKRLNDLNAKYSALGVPLLAINAMDTAVYEEETFALMQKKAMADQFNFPYLQDVTQSAGRNFGATHTPQSYVIWKENGAWVIRYSGAIDDNGQHPEKAKSYISRALDELLAGKTVSTPETQSFGCKIFYR